MMDITRENLNKTLTEEDAFSLKIAADRYLLKDTEKTPQRDDIVIVELETSEENTAGYNTIKEVALVDEYDPRTETLTITIFTGVDRGKTEVVPRNSADVLLEDMNGLKKRLGKALSGGDSKLEREIRERAMSKILFGGRILAGAGTNEELTYFNCYVAPRIHDSRGGIAQHRETVMEIMSRGGGVGTDGSTLRPSRTKVHKVRGRSSGAVSWLNDLSRLTDLVQQGGSRRGAQMITLADFHPDLIEFITAKAQKPLSAELTINGEKETIEFGYRGNDQLSGANISVTISDAFMEAYFNNDDWELVFPDVANYNKEEMEIYDSEWHKYGDPWKFQEATGLPLKTHAVIPARDIANLIGVAMQGSAEPGVVFMERYNYMSNSSYYNALVSTNPCGEQGLPEWGVCNLGHVNLAEHVYWNDDLKKFQFDFDELAQTVRVLTRALGNVVDATPYFFEENKQNQLSERRLGLGTMGADEVLKLVGLDYGEQAGRDFANLIFSTITKTAYKESIELAKERGPFEKFDAEKFLESGFMQFLAKEAPELVEEIKEHGIRNVTIITQAPTGTTGTLAQTSTGIEPFYSGEFYRASRIGMTKQTAPVIKRMEAHGMDTSNLKYAGDYTAKQHLDFQAVAQKWCDSSISKTINAPKGTEVEDVVDLLAYAYEIGLKGFTVYVDGSRETQVLTTELAEGNSELDFAEYPVRNVFSDSTVKLGFDDKDRMSKLVIDFNSLKDIDGDQLKKVLAHITETAIDAHSSTDCEECGGPLKFEEGCFRCEVCGWSRCG